MEKWIECFRPGILTDSAGNTKNWTEDEVQLIASIYNEKIQGENGESFEAPIVKGHPESNDPAFGWVKELKFEDGILKARIAFTVPEFAEEVNNELYKKVSIALYEDLMLRHIGFLGAVPPAVKGLEPVKFNRSEDFLEYRYEENIIEFAITEKPELKREKPAHYVDYKEDEFADPVHFRFPVRTRSETRASMAIFSSEKVAKQYSDEEKQYIASRLLHAAQYHDIKTTPKSWAYALNINVPADMLSKNQLLKVVQNQMQPTNNNISTNKGRFMDPTEWLNAFIAFITTKLSENSNEELATQFQAWADEYVASNPLPGAGQQQTSDPPEGTQASEPAKPIDPQYAEALNRVALLEKENRAMKFNAYIDKQIKAGKLKEGQRELILNSMEAMHSNSTALQFSAGTLQGEDIIKKLIDSFPAPVELGEFAKRDNVVDTPQNQFSAPEDSIADESRMDLHNKALKYAEDNKVPYLIALNKITRG